MNRTVAFGALWTASAASAVGLGLLAVSLVDASASPVTQPIAATESVTAAPSPSGSGSLSGSGADDAATSTPTSPPPAAAPASGEYATVGGTVLASCDGGSLQVAAAPAAGWWLDDSDVLGEVEFESTTQKVEVHVVCIDGVPAFVDEGVRADDNEPEDSGPSSSSSSASSSPSPASSSAGVDDSDGRVGGGHGSDDPPGDDSAGRSDDDGDDDSGKGRGRGGDDSGSDD